MAGLIEELPLPSGEHVLIHARLKGLASQCGVHDYTELAADVLDGFRALNCRSIVVPTFTYSFTKSLHFSVASTPSEVGRFSEEVRILAGTQRRTQEPVFSVVDVDDFGWNKERHLDAFSDQSIWSKWREENAIIVNFDLPHVVATQFHLVERLANVPYRFDKVFRGEMEDAQGTRHAVDYNYYVRDLDVVSTWDRERLEGELRKANQIHDFVWHDVPGFWFRAQDIEKVLLPIMQNDPSYLLKSE